MVKIINKKIHAGAGFVAFLMISIFIISTITSEILGNIDTIYFVKQGILYGLILLVPSMMLTGITGNLITKNKKSKLIQKKLGRLKIIAFNGIFILIPCAFYLESSAVSKILNEWFYIIQILELIAGAVNIYLLGLNIRDGVKLSEKFRKTSALSS